MRAHLAFLALLVGCGGSVDAGTTAGSGGLGPGITSNNATGGLSYVPFPGAGGRTLPETGNSVTGGRAQTATGGQVATSGRVRLAIGGNLPIGGASTCPIGSQGCPCYATNLCATPTLLTCVNGICCTLSGDCSQPTSAGGAPATGGANPIGGVTANGGVAGSDCDANCLTTALCGDGVVESPEQCDYGAVNNTGAYGDCNPNCTWAPYCGDGVTQNPPEQCDNGAANAPPRCPALWQLLGNLHVWPALRRRGRPAATGTM